MENEKTYFRDGVAEYGAEKKRDEGKCGGGA